MNLRVNFAAAALAAALLAAPAIIFAAPASAHDHECLAAVNIERNVVQDRAVAEFPDEVRDLDNRRIR